MNLNFDLDYIIFHFWLFVALVICCFLWVYIYPTPKKEPEKKVDKEAEDHASIKESTKEAADHASKK